MSRLFDAMRKAEGRRAPEPAHVESAPRAGSTAPVTPISTPVAHAAAGPSPLAAHPARVAALHASVTASLPEHVAREMTTLRVNLETALQERVPRVVAFVSAQGGEGNSTVAAQFVIQLTTDPRARVLFVDAHAARPALEIGPGAKGPLAGLFGESVDPHASSPLDVLPVPESARAGSLYAPATLEATLDALGGRYDWVVIDAPPVLYAAESASLAALADGVVVVVEAGRTKKPVLSRSVDLLRKAGGRVIGSVLNRRQLEIPEFIYRRI